MPSARIVHDPNSAPDHCKESSKISQTQNEKTKTDLWLVRFTGVLALVAALQLLALVWQVLTSRDAAEKELRAYLGISKIFLDISDPTLPVGNVEIKNFGRTPAYDVRQWVGILPGTFPLTIEPPRSTLEGSSSILPMDVPQTSIVPLKKTIPPNITFGNPDGITIYVYGEVVYKDAYKRKGEQNSDTCMVEPSNLSD